MGADFSLSFECSILASIRNLENGLRYVKTREIDPRHEVQRILQKLKNEGEKLLKAYDKCVSLGRFVGDDNGNDYQMMEIFEIVKNAFDAFYEFEIRNVVEIYSRQNFVNDICAAMNTLIAFIEMTTPLFGLYSYQTSPELEIKRMIAMNVLKFTFKVDKKAEKPYYSMKNISICTIFPLISKNRCPVINIEGPNLCGKTLVVPVMLASVISEANRKDLFIILLQQSKYKANNLAEFYRENFPRDEDVLHVYTDPNQFIPLYEQGVSVPTIGIFTNLEIIDIINKVPQKEKLFSLTRFIIDDYHTRLINTDALAEILLKNTIKKSQTRPSHIILMSSTPDRNYLRYFGIDRGLVNSIPLNIIYQYEPQVKEVVIGSEKYTTRCLAAVINETRLILNTWGNDDIKNLLISPGNVLIYINGVDNAKKIPRKLQRIYNYRPAVTNRPIVILSTELSQHDTYDSFYNKIYLELSEERADFRNKVVMYYIPFIFAGKLTNDQMDIMMKPVKLQGNQKMIFKIIITTTEFERNLSMYDFRAVIDVGLDNIDHYDTESGETNIIVEPVPAPYREQRKLRASKFDNGYYVPIFVEEMEYPDIPTLPIKRTNLLKSAMELQSVGISLRNLMNLPNGPDYDFIEQLTGQLIAFGIISGNDQKLERTGQEILPYIFLSTSYALALVKFENQFECNEASVFATFVFSIIENCDKVLNSFDTVLLHENFEDSSDVVTLIRTIKPLLNNDNKEEINNHGIDIGSLFEIQENIRRVCTIKYGRDYDYNEALQQMDNWLNNNDILSLLDSLFKSIDSNWKNGHIGTFKGLYGAGLNQMPTCKFESRCHKIRVSSRPGWNGFTIPGACYIFSVNINVNGKYHTGSIIHRSRTKRSEGVISQVVDDCFNTPFFVPVFQAYMGHSKDKFNAIHLGFNEDEDSGFMIHISNSNGRTYLNYIPKNADAKEEMQNALPTLRKVIPVVGRSILVKKDFPRCAVEVSNIGLINYNTLIHAYPYPDAEVPFCYNLNRNVINWASDRINDLVKNDVYARFAITGECCILRNVDGMQADIDLQYPTIEPATVFGDKPSHLVFMIDRDHEQIPNEHPIEWEGREMIPQESNEIDTLVNIENEILGPNGSATYNRSYFVVEFTNEWKIKEGNVPDGIAQECKVENNTFKCQFSDIIDVYTRQFIVNNHLIRAIPPIDIVAPENRQFKRTMNEQQIRRLKQEIGNSFHVGEDRVNIVPYGTLALKIVIEDLQQFYIKHDTPQVGIKKYMPCQADGMVLQAVNSVITDLPALRVSHYLLSSITINHTRAQNLTENEFLEKVDKYKENSIFAFAGDYIQNLRFQENPALIGSVRVNFLNPYLALDFVQKMHKEIKADGYFDPDFQMTVTQTMMSFGHGKGPLLNGQSQYVINEGDFEAVRNRIQQANRNGWKFLEGTNILCIPQTDEEAAVELMSKFQEEEKEILCLFICEGNSRMLPLPILRNESIDRCSSFAVCGTCLKISLMFELAMFYNESTNLINFEELERYPDAISNFPLGNSTYDAATSAMWPQIQLGSILWACLADQTNIPMIAKAWMTAVVERTLQVNKTVFSCCPDHKNVPIYIPKVMQHPVRCQSCNKVYCNLCKNWHEPGDCPEDGFVGKRCNNCNLPSVKTSGCNRITCPACGYSWCWVCDFKALTSNEVYTHMTAQNHW